MTQYHNSSARIFCPKAKVTIDTNKRTYDVSDNIISLTTDKTYGVVEGSFSLQLAPSNKQFGGEDDEISDPLKPFGLEYDDIFSPNDKIKIELDDGGGEGVNTVLVGLLSQIEKTFSVASNGQPVRRVSISGSDMGKVLSKHHCQWYLAPRKENLGTESSITSLVYGAQLYAGGTPSKIVSLILEKELFDRMPWTKNYITDDLINSSDTWSINNAGVSMHSTVSEALRYVSNEPFNKLHGDTRNDGLYHVILEKCPFNNTTGRLDRAVLKTIEPELVVSSSLGKNDHDQVNYLWLKTLVGAFGGAGGSSLLMLKGDAQQYETASVEANGFMPWMPESRFSPFTKNGDPQLLDSLAYVEQPVKDRTDTLWNWYRNNHTYLSGNISLHGASDIRAGEGVLFEGNEYFVESVNHRFEVDKGLYYRTTLHVTRGQKCLNKTQ